MNRFVDPEEYDVIHAHYGPMGRQLDFLTGETPLVVSFYGHDAGRLLRDDPNRYDSLWDRVDGVAALSYEMKQHLIAHGCPADHVSVVPLPVDTSKVEFDPTPPSSPVQVATVARFVEKKGLDYAIRAVDRIAEEYGVEYKIAGDGPLREQIEALIDERSLSDTVELLGWQSQSGVRELLSNSHVFLLPSRTETNGDKEGTPTVLLEAQAAGTPPISTYHAGILEIVEHNERGILSPPVSVDGLGDAIETMLERRDSWAEMARRGRAYVQSRHASEEVASRLETVYESL